MMDARLVWDTWRGLLTSDTLVAAVLGPDGLDPVPLGLPADQSAILADYASTPAATETTIAAYRRGLERNALNALRLVPRARQLLYSGTCDVSEVAADFCRTMHYCDHGPYFWRIAADFVAYLTTRAEFSRPQLQDVLALEAAVIALVRRLGASHPAAWPDRASSDPAGISKGGRYVANPAAATASSRYDLSPWLEDPFEFDVDAELEQSPRHWLIYVPSADAEHCYAELSPLTARVFDQLSVPKTAFELSRALDLSVEEVLDVITSLAEIGVVVCGEGT